MTLWNWILWVLTWLSSDPASLDREAGRAAAAVTVARATMLVEAPAPTPPGPKPTPGKCTECNGTGWIVHGDGHRTRCPCGIGCTTGNCPVPGASSTTSSPSVPAGRR